MKKSAVDKQKFTKREIGHYANQMTNEHEYDPSFGEYLDLAPADYSQIEAESDLNQSSENMVDKIYNMLAKKKDIDSSDVVVTVNNGILVLSGSVKNYQNKFAIETVVDNLSEIKKIQNDIQVIK